MHETCGLILQGKKAVTDHTKYTCEKDNIILPHCKSRTAGQCEAVPLRRGVAALHLI